MFSKNGTLHIGIWIDIIWAEYLFEFWSFLLRNDLNTSILVNFGEIPLHHVFQDQVGGLVAVGLGLQHRILSLKLCDLGQLLRDGLAPEALLLVVPGLLRLGPPPLGARLEKMPCISLRSYNKMKKGQWNYMSPRKRRITYY